MKWNLEKYFFKHNSKLQLYLDWKISLDLKKGFEIKDPTNFVKKLAHEFLLDTFEKDMLKFAS